MVECRQSNDVKMKCNCRENARGYTRLIRHSLVPDSDGCIFFAGKIP